MCMDRDGQRVAALRASGGEIAGDGRRRSEEILTSDRVFGAELLDSQSGRCSRAQVSGRGDGDFPSTLNIFTRAREVQNRVVTAR